MKPIQTRATLTLDRVTLIIGSMPSAPPIIAHHLRSLPEYTTSPSPSNPNPSTRIRPSRPLSPDLPTQDALYLFSNFSSYMQSPNEGVAGIRNSEDFRDTVKLLDYARVRVWFPTLTRGLPLMIWTQSLASQPQSNVHLLHLKYRFHNLSQTIRSPYSTGDWRLPLIYPDSTGRTRNPVPQPFSVLHDPVVKIDYRVFRYDLVSDPLNMVRSGYWRI